MSKGWTVIHVAEPSAEKVTLTCPSCGGSDRAINLMTSVCIGCAPPGTLTDQMVQDFKAKARTATKGAIKRGELVRPDACEGCGLEVKLQVHHPDYRKPLEIEWLCAPCHRAWHRTNQAGIPTTAEEVAS